jgi:ubiquinone/menaquinone biosynthesis C-methylase UbiE
MSGVSFDRAADIYDATRGHPGAVSEQIAASVQAMLPAGARLLEIGVGTGRIQRPLLGRGLDLTGIDLSVEMMHRLIQQIPPHAPAPGLALADAVRLPFPAATFAAVIAVHVFHLIPDYLNAIREVQRVLQVGGMLLAGSDDRPADSPMAVINEQWREIMAEHGVRRDSQRQRDPGKLWGELARQGKISLEQIEVVRWPITLVPEENISNLEKGYYSSSWELAPELLPVCGAELRAWAQERFGDLTRPLPMERTFIWRRIRFLKPL